MKHFVFFVVMIILLGLCVTTEGKSKNNPYSENYYNQKWCKEKHGIPEYRLLDGKRIDCLLPTIAVETDWANYKVYEAVGQSLLYAARTDKRPGILLLIKDEKGFEWVNMIKEINNTYHLNIQIYWLITKERYKK